MENNLLICPYDNSHVVNKQHYQLHVIKCQKRHKHIKLVSCYYNYSHKIKGEEILEHYKICADKREFEKSECQDLRNLSSLNKYRNNYLELLNKKNQEKYELHQNLFDKSLKTPNLKDSNDSNYKCKKSRTNNLVTDKNTLCQKNGDKVEIDDLGFIIRN
ncbi:protein FAM112B, putative [Pediculus humanus corporis]|uniref:Protein FAM112B, putative n=1 Tax=Pediculus humanus subsp. corporis TaxID=121224 RepID=E0VCV4_PEDHC|nr:protein FAM112B, putative [Pediculus humanus corporis]EEB11210.1 protein FAM112B, putative [Pediculus humanus corporis]